MLVSRFGFSFFGFLHPPISRFIFIFLFVLFEENPFFSYFATIIIIIQIFGLNVIDHRIVKKRNEREREMENFFLMQEKKHEIFDYYYYYGEYDDGSVCVWCVYFRLDPFLKMKKSLFKSILIIFNVCTNFTFFFFK